MTASDPIPRLNAALEGRYRIERQLGEGGMATVYLADDLRHERKVALKVLKPELAAVVGAERFLAEIKTTAKLQHPHILPLFDSGEADGFLFYVMPYVEGESLRERLDREHQLPVDEAVQMARNVAEALHYAHSQGVIHRDIKPANILLQAGKPVISDFGIALAVGVAGGGRLTETGLSLGTPHYMSPEQATGDMSVGTPTDIYALGCVLYEALVGHPPYIGGTAQAILGKIVTGVADPVTKHRRAVPANVDAAIRRALEKVPADRFASAQELASALGDPGFRHQEVLVSGGLGARSYWKPLTVGLAGATLAFASAFVWALLRSPPAAAPVTVARFAAPFEPNQVPIGGLALTPDGSAVVYQGPGSTPGTLRLWIRRWDELRATPVSGTDNAVSSFAVSPDGREVAFHLEIERVIRVVPLAGGPGRILVEEAGDVSDWAADGYVYYTRAGVLVRTPGSGDGDSGEVLTELGEAESRHEDMNVGPDGRMGVFSALGPEGESRIWSIDLASGERRALAAGNNPSLTASGHVLFGTDSGLLMAAPIDRATGTLSAAAIPVVEGLSVRELDRDQVTYAVSDNGHLIYAVSGSSLVLFPVWVARETGRATPLDADWQVVLPDGIGLGLALSPEGERLAISVHADGNDDVWIKHLPNGPFERLTFDDLPESYPTWTPDGEHVTYSAWSSTTQWAPLWRRSADGVQPPELVVDVGSEIFQSRWSPDGRWVVYRGAAIIAGPRRDIMGFRPGLDSLPVSLVASPDFTELDPALSPDGRWLAYSSDESGLGSEVYVRPFPDVGSSRVLVSTSGGRAPLWGHSGRELFYLDGDDNLTAAQVEASSEFRVLQRRTLFSTVGYLTAAGQDFYDVAPDDTRFLMLLRDVQGAARHVLVQNFLEELKRLVPTG